MSEIMKFKMNKNSILKKFKKKMKELQPEKRMDFVETEENNSHTILRNWFRNEFICGETILYYTTWTLPDESYIHFNYYITTLEKEVKRLSKLIEYYSNKDNYRDKGILENYKNALEDVKRKCKGE